MHNPISKTPISYYGGKQSMLHHILPLIPPRYMREVYNEPFFGGGSVFWSMTEPSKNETINDKWDIAINFYKTIQTDFPALKKLVDQSLVSRTMHRYAQKLLRYHRSGQVIGNVELAWAFWMCANFSFANKVLYGGIKYSNDSGSVVPEQMRSKKRDFTDWLVFRLEKVYIECNDAITVINSRNVKKAFHYIDPPYPGADQGHYKGYTWEDFEKLLQACVSIKGRFMLSNYPSEMLDRYIQENGWYISIYDKFINASNANNGKRKTEVLVMNYSPTCLIENKLFQL